MDSVCTGDIGKIVWSKFVTWLTRDDLVEWPSSKVFRRFLMDPVNPLMVEIVRVLQSGGLI